MTIILKYLRLNGENTARCLKTGSYNYFGFAKKFHFLKHSIPQDDKI